MNELGKFTVPLYVFDIGTQSFSDFAANLLSLCKKFNK